MKLSSGEPPSPPVVRNRMHGMRPGGGACAGLMLGVGVANSADVRARDPFPLPAHLLSGGIRSRQRNHRRVGRAVFSRRTRLAESSRSLNMLSGCSAKHARHGTWPSEMSSPSDKVGVAQQSILDGMAASISAYGPCPEGLDGRSAFEAVLKSEDFYALYKKNLAPYQPDLLNLQNPMFYPSKHLNCCRQTQLSL